jgi:hypothetical protein
MEIIRLSSAYQAEIAALNTLGYRCRPALCPPDLGSSQHSCFQGNFAHMTVAKEKISTKLLGHAASSGVNWVDSSILVKLTLDSVTNLIFQ